MRRTLACASSLFLAALFALGCPLLAARAEIVIQHTDRGWYTIFGLHLPDNTNYIVGDSRLPGCGPCANDTRNFFVFDLSGISASIASAELAVFLPANPPGFVSLHASENYELHDVVTPFATLLDGTGGVAAHADLGTGVVYGSRTVTLADGGTFVEIPLNSSAIDALNAATGLIGFGGSIASLDGLANDEYMFGWTHDNIPATELRLSLVPEPSSSLLCLATGICAVRFRRVRGF